MINLLHRHSAESGKGASDPGGEIFPGSLADGQPG